MAPQLKDSTHLRQYFEHLAGNTYFMHALQINADLSMEHLAFEDKPGLAKSAGHLKLLTTKNSSLVPGSLKRAFEMYFLQCHRRKNAACSKKQTIARALGLHATTLTAQALAATGTVKVIIHDCFDDSSFKWGTLLVDCGNENLVGSGNTALSVPVDESCVIDEAVNSCKEVRPTHGGDLIQFGWNAGPWHACVFGLVNNLTMASLPAEAIDEAGLPSMTIKGDNLDSGYTLDLPNGSLCFSTAERAPSEGYMSQNYEFPIHTDQLYAFYAMNWVTLHSIVDSDQCQLHGDCSSGGNYVDVSLRVVVKCATDTVM
ncbi:hypothetical protein BDR04DRAFT_1123744, partial [Suillus decipiens]